MVAAGQGRTHIHGIRLGPSGSLSVEPAPPADGIAAGHAILRAFALEGRSYLLGYGPQGGELDYYQPLDDWSGFDRRGGATVDAGWKIIEPFVLGNRPHLMCYGPAKGTFRFFAIGDDLGLSRPYEFARHHDPGLSLGFTTVKPFVHLGEVAFLGYNQTNGHVAIYTLRVVAHGHAGAAPLQATTAWSHDWAAGWTRFAFFTLGGAVFFLKTNVKKDGVARNVNIDHILDGLDGTIEIGTRLDLKDAGKLTLVEPFTLGNGDPYFAAYKPGGHVALYRFWSDCRGWDPAGEFDSKKGARHMLAIPSGDSVKLLIH